MKRHDPIHLTPTTGGRMSVKFEIQKRVMKFEVERQLDYIDEKLDWNQMRYMVIEKIKERYVEEVIKHIDWKMDDALNKRLVEEIYESFDLRTLIEEQIKDKVVKKIKERLFDGGF